RPGSTHEISQPRRWLCSKEQAIPPVSRSIVDGDIEPGSEPSHPIARPGSTHEISQPRRWLCSKEQAIPPVSRSIVDG
ncbi:hypothetical protein R3X46_25050, partial [Salmonella enterica subsp. enterica serovar Agona]|nr:hypothetical protein [Salmonella enterica subsp. enterica serovar Agona]